MTESITFVALPPDISLRLEVVSDLVESDIKCLSDDEKARHAAFGHSDRRAGFLLGRKAAKALAREALGAHNDAAIIEVRDDGSPTIPNSQFEVSISHAGSGDQVHALAALASRRIGVDMEAIVPRREDLYKRILYPDEYGLLDVEGLEHNEAQVLLWSLKESVLKGLRTGFRRSARTIHLDDLSNGTGHAHVGDGPSWHLRYAKVGAFWATIAFLD